MIRLSNRLIQKRFSPTFKEFLNLGLFEEKHVKMWVGGGALRHLFSPIETIADFDLFFHNSLAAAAVEVALESKGFDIIFKCPEGKLTTFRNKETKMKIQIVKQDYYPNAEVLINTFDIKACQFAYDGSTLTAPRAAIRDVRRTRINLNLVTYPNATMKRVQKYIQKGYTLTNEAVELFIETVYKAGQEDRQLDRRFYID